MTVFSRASPCVGYPWTKKILRRAYRERQRSRGAGRETRKRKREMKYDIVVHGGERLYVSVERFHEFLLAKGTRNCFGV